MGKHYVLLDACVAAAHYAPKTTMSANLRKRAGALLSGHSDEVAVQFLIPNFCIAEVFAVFEKYRWGRTWNKHVKKQHCLMTTEFSKARAHFHAAIHNGAKILQQDLNRYHILAVDLISPVNNAYSIQRKKGKNAKKDPRPASTYDMLVAAMGIWLQHQFGKDNFTLITGDARICQVVARAKSVSLAAPMKQHLRAIAEGLGLSYSPSLYPEVINLINAAPRELKVRLPGWTPAW
jgi:hypothetical protein